MRLINNKLLLSLFLLIFSNLFISYYYFSYSNQTGIEVLLYSLFFLLLFIGLWKGIIISLGICLLFIFLLGSYIFLGYFTAEHSLRFFQNIENSHQLISISAMIFWQLSFIASSFISSLCHSQIEVIISKYRYWSKQYNDLVTIDPKTGLANEKRFFVQLHEQFKRSERYDQYFTLLLIRIQNWKQFDSLYKQADVSYVLSNFSTKLKMNTRSSDSRFRIADDTFALILPETNSIGTQRVIEKINDNRGYVLKKKNRIVKLTFEFGYIHYDKNLHDYMGMFNSAMEELNQHIS